MSAGHTPGPWRVESGTSVIWSYNAYDQATNNVGCIVARAANPPSPKASRPTFAEQCANARLIAAAPDLLSLVHRFIALPSCAWHPERHAAEELELTQEARALIAALDGETP